MAADVGAFGGMGSGARTCDLSFLRAWRVASQDAQKCSSQSGHHKMATCALSTSQGNPLLVPLGREPALLCRCVSDGDDAGPAVDDVGDAFSAAVLLRLVNACGDLIAVTACCGSCSCCCGCAALCRP
jgi:hypothetical protein